MPWAAVVLAAIALVLGLSAISRSMPTPQSLNLDPSQPLFSDDVTNTGALNTPHVENIPWGFKEGVIFGPSLQAREQIRQLSLAVGQNDAVWTNANAQTVYVNLAQITTTGVASSTLRVTVFATSTSSIPNSMWNTAPAFSASSTALFRLSYATSTAATTTNSVMAAVSGKGDGLIAVLPGASLHLYLQTVDSIACQVAKQCEFATSTNRGIRTVTLNFHYNLFDGMSGL